MCVWELIYYSNYFYVQGNSSFGSVVYSKLEVIGRSRVGVERPLGFRPVELGLVLAVLKLTSCVTSAT